MGAGDPGGAGRQGTPDERVGFLNATGSHSEIPTWARDGYPWCLHLAGAAATRFFKGEGPVGRFGVAAISVVAFQTILMTYLGVNHLLGTGLHSYGCGDSPRPPC